MQLHTYKSVTIKKWILQFVLEACLSLQHLKRQAKKILGATQRPSQNNNLHVTANLQKNISHYGFITNKENWSRLMKKWYFVLVKESFEDCEILGFGDESIVKRISVI